MVHYLIEFRFHGKAKYEIKQLVYEINRRFKLGYRRVIPHITLVGPFYTNDENRLIEDFNSICSKSPLSGFEIDGFNTFENTGVVFLDVKPSRELEEFRWNLSQLLQSYCQLTSYDMDKEFAFQSRTTGQIPQKVFLMA